MLYRAFAIAFVIGLLLGGSQGQQKEASLQPLLELLDKSELPGSLEFSGRCSSFQREDFPEFPKFHTPATGGGSALQTVRSMFAGHPEIHVWQEDGIIRMIESDVATDILDVRIAHIAFPKGTTARFALDGILGAPEVRLFMKVHRIEEAYGGVRAISVWLPEPLTAPRFYGPLDNVTVSQAMDRILGTFPGIWVYENCPKTKKRSRIVYLDFYQFHRAVK